MNFSFSPARLRGILSGLPATPRYWVAFSGGPDSHALLHALAQLRRELSRTEVMAAHVNHGLRPEADAWEAHCRHICAGLQIGLHCLKVDAEPEAGESPEEAARHRRYGALASLLDPGDVMMTAHHQDDQAETVLVQLLRGAGPRGLAGMPRCVGFGKGWLARPLLLWSRRELERYGRACGLESITDLSNYDARYDRNFVRHEIMPRLQARWSSVSAVLDRVSAHQADLASLADVLGRMDLKAATGPTCNTLSCTALCALPMERRRNVLRFWMRSLGLPVPAQTHVERVLSDVMGAGPDRSPQVRWPGAEVRRYRDLLYAMRPLVHADRERIYEWRVPDPLSLPYGRLEAREKRGQGLSVGVCMNEKVTVRFRQGGERCQPAGRGHTHSLKKLFQEQGIPPWQRNRLPLTYVGGGLAAVGDLWVCEPFAAADDEAGWILSWADNAG